jgi:hypothetical protein
VVIVASSARVLSMTALPYPEGTPATASRGRTTRYAAIARMQNRRPRGADGGGAVQGE